MGYHFKAPLKKGLVKNRPNRFVMAVESSNQLLRCRCPSPTRIGNVEFRRTPCLLSKNTAKGRTTHTVEAIRLKMASGGSCWVGINQTRVNAICKHFMDSGRLHRLIQGEKFEQNKKINNSIIDFASDNSLLEIKTPLTVLPNLASDTVNYSHSGDYERTIRHCRVLRQHVKSGGRAIMLLAYLYPAPLFNPLKQNSRNKMFVRAIRQAYESGVEFWQVNYAVTTGGVELDKYTKLRFVF